MVSGKVVRCALRTLKPDLRRVRLCGVLWVIRVFRIRNASSLSPRLRCGSLHSPPACATYTLHLSLPRRQTCVVGWLSFCACASMGSHVVNSSNGRFACGELEHAQGCSRVNVSHGSARGARVSLVARRPRQDCRGLVLIHPRTVISL